MPELVENDSSHMLLRHLLPEIILYYYIIYVLVADLVITFQTCIGAYFLLKWFLLPNPSRTKGRKKMVTDSTKMAVQN